MKQIEENLNELLDVFDGSGVPNNSWVKNKLEETLILVKTNATPDQGRMEQLNCDHEWRVDTFDCYGFPTEQYCDKCDKKEAI